MVERRLRGAWLGVACAAILAACGSSPEAVDAGGPPPEGDAGPAMGHEGTLELGTGATEFVPVADGDTVGLSRGYQGLQHVYVSLRLHDVDPELAITELSLTRERDGVVISEPFRVRVPYDVTGSVPELIGQRLVTPDEEQAFGEPLLLSARVEGRDGSWAAAEAHIHVVWDRDLGGTP